MPLYKIQYRLPHGCSLQRPSPWEQQTPAAGQQQQPSLWDPPAAQQSQSYPALTPVPRAAQPGMRESFGGDAVFTPLAQGRHFKRSSSMGSQTLPPQPSLTSPSQQPAHMHRKSSLDFSLHRPLPPPSPDPKPPSHLLPRQGNPFGDDVATLASQPQVLPVDGLSAEAVEGLFQTADWDHDGLLSGPEAVAVFQRTGLSERQLKRVRCRPCQLHAC